MWSKITIKSRHRDTYRENHHRDVECPHPIWLRKVNELTQGPTRYWWNILGLAEVRWPGFVGATTEEGHKLLHPHKLSGRTTRYSLSGKIHNHIDDTLTPRRFKSSMNKTNTRTFPGADTASDRDMVLATLKLKLNKIHHKKSPRILFDTEKLKIANFLG